MRVRYTKTGFTPIPNLLVDLWPLLELQAVDFLILSVLFRFAYAGAPSVKRGQRDLARLVRISDRHFRDRLAVMEKRRFGELPMLPIRRSPGRESEVDLDGLIRFLEAHKKPRLAGVDRSGKLSTTPEPQFRTTPEPQFRGSNLWKSQKGEGIQGDEGKTPGDNKQDVIQDLVETTGRPAEISPKNGSSRSAKPDPDGKDLIGLLFPNGLREEIRKSRTEALSGALYYGISKARPAIEERIRLELRGLGMKVSAIGRLFRSYPVDGILYWLNKAHEAGRRNPAGFVIAMLEKTGGEYPARKGAA